MIIYVVTDKEGKIVQYSEDIGKLKKEFGDDDKFNISLGISCEKKDEISNGRVYPILINEDNGEASLEIFESIEAPSFIEEPEVSIEFINTNKYIIFVSTVFSFEEDYELIRTLTKYLLTFIFRAKDGIDNVDKIVENMNELYPVIPGLQIPIYCDTYENEEKMYNQKPHGDEILY